MLTPDYLLHISEGAEEIAETLHQEIINRIIERIMYRMGRGDEYILTAQDKWQLEVLQDAGYLLQDIQKEIASKTKLQQKEIKAAMEDAGVRAIDYDDAIYTAAGLSPRPLEQSPALVRIMQRNYEATLGEWKNFTKTTANAAQQSFLKAMDKAYTLVSSGAVSYTQAVRDAVEEISGDGVEVYYPTGHKDTIETAALRAVRAGISQMSGQITDARMEEMGWDIILVSSHLGARVTETDDFTNHSWWQGKFYSRTGEDKRFPPFSVCGMGRVQGIHGANCRHSHGPGDGENNPFEQYDTEENRKAYELQQRQRTLERRIRKTKREVMALKTAVDNAQDEKLKIELDMAYQKKAALLKKQNKAYADFCEENGLKRLSDRLQVAKWDRQQAANARGAAQRYEHAEDRAEGYDKLLDSAKRKYDDITRMVPPVSLNNLNGDVAGELKQAIDQTPPVIKRLIQNNGASIRFAKINAVGRNRATSKGIFINLADDKKNDRGAWSSTFHEIGHDIDRIYKRASHNTDFSNALRNDFDIFTKTYMSMYNINVNDAYRLISESLVKATARESHVLSDLFGGMTKNRCVGNFFHQETYWNKKYSLEHEAFAHFFSATALGYKDKIDAIKDVFPEAYKEFIKIVSGL